VNRRRMSPKHPSNASRERPSESATGGIDRSRGDVSNSAQEDSAASPAEITPTSESKTPGNEIQATLTLTNDTQTPTELEPRQSTDQQDLESMREYTSKEYPEEWEETDTEHGENNGAGVKTLVIEPPHIDPRSTTRPRLLIKKSHKLQAYELACYGKTNDEIADIFGINRATFYRKMAEDDQLRDAISRGRRTRVSNVESMLLKTAMGEVTSEEQVKVRVRGSDGKERVVQEVTKTRRHAPNYDAQRFILLNWDPENYRERHFEIDNNVTMVIAPAVEKSESVKVIDACGRSVPVQGSDIPLKARETRKIAPPLNDNAESAESAQPKDTIPQKPVLRGAEKRIATMDTEERRARKAAERSKYLRGNE
jgi:hypothetical protein